MKKSPDLDESHKSSWPWLGEVRTPGQRRACFLPSFSEFTFTFAICCRPSVCRLSVTLVRPTQAIEIFGNISTAFGTLAIR